MGESWAYRVEGWRGWVETDIEVLARAVLRMSPEATLYRIDATHSRVAIWDGVKGEWFPL